MPCIEMNMNQAEIKILQGSSVVTQTVLGRPTIYPLYRLVTTFLWYIGLSAKKTVKVGWQ